MPELSDVNFVPPGKFVGKLQVTIIYEEWGWQSISNEFQSLLKRLTNFFLHDKNKVNEKNNNTEVTLINGAETS